MKNRNAEMKIRALGLIAFTMLPLAGCSQPVDVSRVAVRLRDRVVADAATSEAQRTLQYRTPQDYDGSGFRHAAKPDAPPKVPGQATDPNAAPTVGPDGKLTDPATTPAAPPSAPVYYYYPTSPTVTPAPAPQ